MKRLMVITFIIIGFFASSTALAQTLEERLAKINIILSEVPGQEEWVREWLTGDPAYKTLAKMVLQEIGDARKVMHRIPLDVINGKFKMQLGHGPSDYITAENYDNPKLIRKTIFRTWKERHLGSSRLGFENILVPVRQIPISTMSGGAVFIEVHYPKKKQMVPVHEFIAKGSVISKVSLPPKIYIYSILKTDQYYRQGSERLDFVEQESTWSAHWELDEILGRPADIGLEGVLHLFVVDLENYKKLVKYYMYPRKNLHSEKEISVIALLKWPIERSIPE